MAAHNKTLKLIASKLGLGEEEKVISKAAEFERLLQTKPTAGSIVTDTCKAVICLDLAATVFGVDFDNKVAAKYSGLRAPSYANCRKIVENLLELNSNTLNIPFLCVSLHCASVQPLAEKILEEYRKQAKTEIDLKLPQYVCMAVYQACRVNKIKISKSKLIEKSRLKTAQWTKLDADWTKIVDEKFATVKRKGRTTKIEDKDGVNEKTEVSTSSPTQEKEFQIEPYEDWKKRMLETAYMEVRKLEDINKKEEQERRVQKKQMMKKELTPQRRSPRKTSVTFSPINKDFASPRRSPRKTPQKFSPYKSPQKPVNGIRILFP